MKRAVFALLAENTFSLLSGKSTDVTVKLSKDGGSLVNATSTVHEIGSGYYYVDLTNAELTIDYGLLIVITCSGAQHQSYYIDKDETAKPGDAMTLTVAYDAAKTASQLTSSDIPTVASIQSGLAKTSDIPTVAQIQSGLATSSELATVDGVVDAIKAKTDNLPASPAATGDAMTLTAAYDAAKTASQLTTSDIPTVASIQSGLAKTTDIPTVAQIQSGLATSSELATVDGVVDAIKAKTDNLPASPAATGDAMTLTTAYDAAKTASQLTASDIPTVASIQSGLAKTTDIPTVAQIQSGLATSSELATVDGVVDAIKAKTDNLPASPAATGDAMTLTSDYNAAKTASQLTTSDIPTVQAIQSGLASESALDSLITIATAVKNKTDNLPTNPAATGDAMTLTTATVTNIKSGLATSSELAKVYSAMCHWSMVGTTLTTYNESGTTLQTFDLTKDSSGNITAIEEAEADE